VPTDLAGLLRLAGRYWRLVVLCGVAGVLAIMAVMVAQGPNYIVTAKIMVRLGPEIATPPMVAARERTHGMGLQRPEDAASVVEILSNPRLIRATVDSLGEDFFADRPPQTLWQHVKHVARTAYNWARDLTREAMVLTGLRPPTTRMDRIVLSISQGLRVEPVRRTDVIDIVLGFPYPGAGEIILARYIELALEDHVQAHRAPGGLAYFEATLADSRAELLRVEQALQAARTRGTPVWSVAEQRSLLLRTQSELSAQYRAAQSAEAESAAEVARAEVALAAQPETIVLSSVRARNRTIDELRTRLIQLRIDQVSQRARYGDASPEVAELARQSDMLEALLDAEPENRMTEVSEGANMVHQGLLRDLEAKRIHHAGQRVRTERMAAELAVLARDLEQLGAASIEIGHLEREEARLRRLVDTYERGAADARLAEAMETVKLSGLRVVMPPTAEIIPSQPSIRRGLLMGSVAGVVLAMAAVFLLEQRRHRLAGRDGDGQGTALAPPAA
jgi:uncharacterized protein involved in exopolysaccharide biosynthesis